MDQPKLTTQGGITATGTLFLSRSRPTAQRAADDTFSLQIRAVDRISPHQAEPWVVLWAGDSAQEFWERNAARLVPGAGITVELARLRTHVVGRTLPDIHAVASSVALLADSERAAAQPEEEQT